MEKRKDKDGTVRGRAGGLVGGPARAAALSAERRVEIARQGGYARWMNDGLKRAMQFGEGLPQMLPNEQAILNQAIKRWKA
jgi:hypothetical protein